MADSLRQTAPPLYRWMNFAAQQDSACAWFTRAYTLYNNDTLLRDAAAWCVKPDTFDRKTPPEASARQQTTRIPVITGAGEAGAAEDDLAAGLPPGPCTDEKVLAAWAAGKAVPAASDLNERPQKLS
ncbi:MAG: hypothetical protein IPJ82_11745 [Lewinellaceae bacterium]|nr:hypothetical protein [Lewinellaceae bacterium]